MRQEGVFLIDQPAVRSGFLSRFAGKENFAAGRWKMGQEAGDDPKHGRLAAAGRSHDRDQLTFVRQVVDYERNILDGHLRLRPFPKRFGHVAEGDQFRKRALFRRLL